MWNAIAWGLIQGLTEFLPISSSGHLVLVPAVALAGDWRTDLYIFNYDTQTATVDVDLLVRGQANPTPESATFVVAPGETAVLENVLADTFGKGSFAGAIRITSDREVVVNTRIFNYKEGVTFGQGFEGVPVPGATQTGSAATVVGLTFNSSFRTNVSATAGSP